MAMQCNLASYGGALLGWQEQEIVGEGISC